MKFNEKLIALRKKEGLSQEELGFKLNVTRQTVSKWELGQTTPEMDKLIEIGKTFNISVDELINESEISELGVVASITISPSSSFVIVLMLKRPLSIIASNHSALFVASPLKPL